MRREIRRLNMMPKALGINAPCIWRNEHIDWPSAKFDFT